MGSWEPRLSVCVGGEGEVRSNGIIVVAVLPVPRDSCFTRGHSWHLGVPSYVLDLFSKTSLISNQHIFLDFVSKQKYLLIIEASEDIGGAARLLDPAGGLIYTQDKKTVPLIVAMLLSLQLPVPLVGHNPPVWEPLLCAVTLWVHVTEL